MKAGDRPLLKDPPRGGGGGMWGPGHPSSDPPTDPPTHHKTFLRKTKMELIEGADCRYTDLFLPPAPQTIGGRLGYGTCAQ